MSLARAQLDASLDKARIGAAVSRGMINQADRIDASSLDRALQTNAVEARVGYPSSEIGSLAELLGDETTRRTGGMICPCCTTPTHRVVRVRPGGSPRWVAACAMCAGKLLSKYPATLVGGAVRPRARRAG